MRTERLRVLGLTLLLLLTLTTLAHAQATRTWVSGVGDDANPCSRTAPCKTFAGAISKTAPGGEIDVLDPGGFGALTITKAISIEADGLVAGVLVSGTNGFVIAAGATDTVTLRGLTFEGIGTGLNGVSILSAGTVLIDHCYINGFTNDGVNVSPGAPATNTNVTIQNTTIKGTTGTAPNGYGIYVKPAAGTTVNLTVNGVTSNMNQAGALRLETSSAKATVRDSNFSLNTGGNAVVANTSSTISIDNTLIAGNANGIVASNSGTVRISNVSLWDNTNNAINLTGGTVLSFENNRIVGTITGGTLTTQAQQ
jgi:Right handed beta helix region